MSRVLNLYELISYKIEEIEVCFVGTSTHRKKKKEKQKCVLNNLNVFFEVEIGFIWKIVWSEFVNKIKNKITSLIKDFWYRFSSSGN